MNVFWLPFRGIIIRLQYLHDLGDACPGVVEGDDYQVGLRVRRNAAHALYLFDDTPYRLSGVRSFTQGHFDLHGLLCRGSVVGEQQQAKNRYSGDTSNPFSCHLILLAIAISYVLRAFPVSLLPFP